MAIYKVRKRNGSIETFDRTKIEHAIMQTIQSVGGDDFSHVTSLTDQVIKHMEQSCNMQIPDIEVIQDTIEEILIKNGHDAIAKTFIIYRKNRSEARSSKNVVVEVGKTMENILKNPTGV
ncbi:hypothetical protein H6769_02725 [Candidatus Peribacteria bacterium]|nr:hypothetical protein [Candidatus Peribacteria bacterium]